MKRTNKKPKAKSVGEQQVFDFEGAKIIPLAVRGDKVVVNGHSKLASEVRDLRQRIEALAAQNKAKSVDLMRIAKIARHDAEVDGNFQKSVHVVTEYGKPVMVVFGDSYKEIDVVHEALLREALTAERYDRFFGRFVKVKARDGATLERLKEVLGDKFDAFLGVVEVSEYLYPCEGFMEGRAGLRPMLSAEANKTLDTIIGQVQNDPTVRVK